MGEVREHIIVAKVNVCSYVNGGGRRMLRSLFSKGSNVNVTPSEGRLNCHSSLDNVVRGPGLGNLLSHHRHLYLSRRNRCTFLTAARTLKRTNVSGRCLAGGRINVLCNGSDDTRTIVAKISVVHRGEGAMLYKSNGVFRSVGSALAVGLSAVFGLHNVGFAISKTYTDNSRTVNVNCLLVGRKLRRYVLYNNTRRIGGCSINGFSTLGTFSAHRSRPRGTSHPFSGGHSKLIPDNKTTALMLRDCRSTVGHKTAVLTRVIKCKFSSGNSRVSMPGMRNPGHSLRVTVRSTNVSLRRVGCMGTRTASAPVNSLGRTGTVTRMFNKLGPFMASAGSFANRRV